MKEPTIVGLCVLCEIPMCSARHKPPRGAWYDKHKGRNLCAGCYGVNRRNGTLERFPRNTRPRDESYARWLELQELGHSRQGAAAKLGMSYVTFERMRYIQESRIRAMAAQ